MSLLEEKAPSVETVVIQIVLVLPPQYFRPQLCNSVLQITLPCQLTSAFVLHVKVECPHT